MTNLILYGGVNHPALPAMRLALRQAMIDADQLPAWTETYADDPAAPPTLRASGRLLWRFVDQRTVPSADSLQQLINAPGPPIWRQRLSRTGQLTMRFLSALFIAFFPKCPFCWAAYMSYLGVTGVVSISYRPWLIWLLAGLLITNVLVLYQTRQRHGLGPFYVCLTGASIVILNRVFWQEPPLLWLGAGCLLAGSLWNSLSPKMTDSLRYFARWLAFPTSSQT